MSQRHASIDRSFEGGGHEQYYGSSGGDRDIDRSQRIGSEQHRGSWQGGTSEGSWGDRGFAQGGGAGGGPSGSRGDDESGVRADQWSHEQPDREMGNKRGYPSGQRGTRRETWAEEGMGYDQYPRSRGLSSFDDDYGRGMGTQRGNDDRRTRGNYEQDDNYGLSQRSTSRHGYDTSGWNDRNRAGGDWELSGVGMGRHFGSGRDRGSGERGGERGWSGGGDRGERGYGSRERGGWSAQDRGGSGGRGFGSGAFGGERGGYDERSAYSERGGSGRGDEELGGGADRGRFGGTGQWAQHRDEGGRSHGDHDYGVSGRDSERLGAGSRSGEGERFSQRGYDRGWRGSQNDDDYGHGMSGSRDFHGGRDTFGSQRDFSGHRRGGENDFGRGQRGGVGYDDEYSRSGMGGFDRSDRESEYDSGGRRGFNMGDRNQQRFSERGGVGHGSGMNQGQDEDQSTWGQGSNRRGWSDTHERGMSEDSWRTGGKRNR